ncbi:MAG TPA: molybdopterin molybdotransferase MoeA [Methanothermobacter sp.]|jgi:molybdopterin molybdotransferase|uniref:Molybdopterin molybdenumtransferase MoeA n=1 Tax=Methanothermobacter tenebrarum TaxID=680118 RepID=A0ABM7YFJ3_9EURY|nr:gephyrin-like molybdotransferase Glp [Methanothermobacter tenebrarum]MDD3454946.1 molybdopterin molybdotransferase MoeA [Methanobacteriales archaeon]MDX9692735.1 molybdopterin molybdotransferase MoeA [Methanothermobacter sp.]BDH80123.1 molybdopterin molybdenumtransferase MoeA [Methanothermobacter tenebrarum]HHW15919.1 molybdopterin molybdotransferase MoeA [Methanothermobacter sp.]HOQ20405.1 molybdopterin molybdotransferase MoeA [Methanothermobacter sp.]
MFISELLPVKEAFKLLDENQKLTSEETIDLINAHGRVNSRRLTSKLDSPPFDKAAMDGYAIKAEDTFQARADNPIKLKVIDAISAGNVSNVKVRNGEAIKIATGAPIPEGADAVIMEEYTNQEGNEIEVLQPTSPGENIAPKGEDIKAGETILEPGTVMRPQELAITASAGYNTIKVYKKPRVKIIITGDELIEPGTKPGPGKIINSNKYSLKALVESAKASPTVEHSPDNPKILKEKIEEAIRGYDMIITTGGTAISKGDIVVDTVDKLGQIIFHGVAIRPGKPLAFGLIEDKPVFMLSGYPVAAMVQFDIFVRYYLLRMQNINYEHELVERICQRKTPSRLGRTDYIRAFTDDKIAESILISGSGVIKSMVKSNSYIVIEENTEGIDKNSKCNVILFDSFKI